MKPILIAGTVIVTFAQISYSIAIFNEKKKVLVTKLVLVFLTIRIALDVTATTCMIMFSEIPPFTFIHDTYNNQNHACCCWMLEKASGIEHQYFVSFSFFSIKTILLLDKKHKCD